MRRLLLPLLLALHLLSCSSPLLDAPAPPQIEATCRSAEVRLPGIVFAGSGSNLPLTREILGAFQAQRPEARFYVPESIGTQGAVEALLDGAIDVGLASRPLKPHEEAQGLVAIPFARSIVVLATNPGPTRYLNLTDVERAFRGELRTWPGSADVLVPALREEGDSSHQAIAPLWPGVLQAMESRRASADALIFYTDRDMADGLTNIPGAVGLLDLGLIRLEQRRLQPVWVDGVEPDAEAVRQGRYGAVKTLYFLTKGEPRGVVREIILFALSPPMQRRLEGYGYLPLH